MNWWIERREGATHTAYPHYRYNDPGDTLGLWRKVKIERGLVRHPSRDVRLEACSELIALSGWGQDECWENLSEQDRAYEWNTSHCCSASEVAAWRQNFLKFNAPWWWANLAPVTSGVSLQLSVTENGKPNFASCTSRSIPVTTTRGVPRTSRLPQP